MNQNKLKATISQGKAAVGCWLTLSDAAVVEILGLAGYDFALIDMEHASLDFQTVENIIRTAEMAGITPVVRVGANDENWILRVMESGAHAVMVPHIMDAAAARRAVEAAKYEPLGIRGISAISRSSRWGLVGLEEHTRTSNEQTMVIPMVEDVEGVENIEEILAVEGVDLVFVGPADLARAYGVTSEKDPPAVREAFERCAAAAKRVGKPLGTGIFHAAFGRGYRDLSELGVRFITYSTDAGVLMRGLKENLKRALAS